MLLFIFLSFFVGFAGSQVQEVDAIVCVVMGFHQPNWTYFRFRSEDATFGTC